MERAKFPPMGRFLICSNFALPNAVSMLCGHTSSQRACPEYWTYMSRLASPFPDHVR